MLIYGNLKSNKTEILIENYARLINEGISADEILVIVQNSKMKEEFVCGVKKLLKRDGITKFNIYSYFGLCYNFVSDYYPLIEEKITKGNSEIFPNLCGLEASRHIFKNAIDKIAFKGYNSKTNLLHQLLRRQSLITLNALSDDEVKEKTRILSESFTLEIKNAINIYKQKTLEFRAFDYLRQVQLFSYLYKNVQNPYRYVFLDDADEIVPSLFEYLKFIKPDIKEFFVCYDPLGTSRKGYLCAFENNFELFLNETPVVLDKENSKEADLIFENVKEGKSVTLKNLKEKDYIRADEMAEALVSDVNSLLNNGVKPDDILIVIPEEDEFLKLYLNKISSVVNFVTGSEKIEDNKTVSGFISILKLLIENENYRISPYKLKALLGQVLKVNLDCAIKISQEFEADFGAKNIFEILNDYKEEGNIGRFLELKDEIKTKNLSEILYILAFEFLEKTKESKEDIQKINQLLKQIRDFEAIFKEEVNKKELLSQLENTIISENPLENNRLVKNAVNVSTIQKAIDFKIKNKYLFLFDTTNSNWTKQDIGPLYNAWVFSKNWIKRNFTLEDNINLANDKTARSLRKLYLLNDGEIVGYSSVYTFLGVENFKGIKHFFDRETKEIKPEFKIIPRPDQKPVLDYQGGKYAVMAVAGAGKTTIMLALIMKLLENGIKPENIFVLTYMDSAARTFKERIKLAYPDMVEMPNISTIHGLSMRILRENNNHAHLGLDVDFDIIDEIKRLKLITEIIYNEGIETSKSASYERAISAFKNSKNRNENNLSPVFKRVYLEYQRNLKSLNLIDYDDLLILALELLKGNSKIREYYQNLAHYVIEDEAQDSSAIQQELINIISKNSGNLIRSGDVNQAITATFTNSDTQGFKRFIQNGESCKMNYTARNSTGVIDLANRLIKEGIKLSSDSFFEIETKPVSGKNIIDPKAYQFEIFEKEEEEKRFMVETVKEIFSFEKNASVGILTRTNKEAENLANYIKGATPFKVIAKSGLLSDNPIFSAVLSVFNFIASPMNNKIIADFAKTMTEFGFYKNDIKIFDILKENKPFILENNEDFAMWWDLRYFLELTVLSPFELAFKIGEFYFENDKKRKINIAPVSSLVGKIFNSEGNFEDTLNKMNELKVKSGNIKLFEEEETKEEGNEIKILTLHKSKGDEFDYVFIPGLNERNLGLKEDEIKLKESAKIVQSVQNSKKTDSELKKEIIDENLRLLYVGITRAKKKLYLTSAKEYKIFNQIKKTKISKCFELLGCKKGGLNL
ncbi:MAG: UvrD-helicase domain-containing protein [bacterium]|nr:UvrD-helicase domain-containing protein [bacterium]